MDYIGYQCPVCQKYFHADDDIVVCPDCGTPHHRECYEQLGHCCNESLHAQNYDYQKEHEKNKEKIKVCPSCGKENNDTQFFCSHCGAPLSQNQTQSNQQQSANYGQGMPYGNNGDSPFNIPFMDPLGGVPSDTDFGDGVTAGETAKYVKQNTPYFIRIFSNIKNFNKSKFNFAAAIFTGGYMLYRKMYKLGALFASLQLALLIVETYISIAYNSLFVNFLNNVSSTGNIYEFMNKLSNAEILALSLPTLIDFIRIAMMISIGICFNRMYMKHCKKQIISIKSNAKDDETPDSILQTRGGVNTALAISLAVAYIIVVYLPNFITIFF